LLRLNIACWKTRAMEVDPKITNEHPRLALNRCLGAPATFDLIGEEGQPNDKIFTVKTVVKGQEFIGKGRSKKLANQHASELALLSAFNMKYVAKDTDNGHQQESILSKRKADGDANGQAGQNIPVKTSLMRLNELMMGKGMSWQCSEKGDKQNKVYNMTVVINGQSYQGEGPSKQAAKQNAAVAAVKVMEPSFVEGEPVNKKLKGKGGPSVQIEGGVTMTGDHPRMVLNQKEGKPVEVQIVESTGKGKNIKFKVKVFVQGKEFFGCAANKKAAAQQACENAIWELYGIKYNGELSKSPKVQKGSFVSGGVQMMS